MDHESRSSRQTKPRRPLGVSSKLLFNGKPACVGTQSRRCAVSRVSRASRQPGRSLTLCNANAFAPQTRADPRSKAPVRFRSPASRSCSRCSQTEEHPRARTPPKRSSFPARVKEARSEPGPQAIACESTGRACRVDRSQLDPRAACVNLSHSPGAGDQHNSRSRQCIPRKNPP